MINLSRRSLLVGTSALAAASLVSVRASAQARTYHALLVACTDYPSLPKRNWLIGPKNDAVLVRDYLLNNSPEPVKFLPENITMLASEVEGANGAPTHDNIKAAFAALAAKVQRDDFVYLHMSGHGAQQPQSKAGNETDGLDEIFLPSDIGRWSSQEAGVPNALIDDDMGAALNAIRDKGAFIWIIFDCCHSGTATRAAEVLDEMERKVEFADLVEDGLKAEGEKALAAATAAVATRGFDEKGERKPAFSLAQPTGAEPITKGKMVAFYAAQSIETTPEMPLPKGTPDAERFGLFTFTIFAKLAENPNITYRQLGQAVLQQYSADSRTRPTPLFEGELDARVFGTVGNGAIMQWPLVVKDNQATVGAGLLHRLTPGTKLAVLPSALSPMSEAVGYLEVKSAKNLESRLAPAAWDDKKALTLAELPANAYVRVAELAVDYKLVVARPSPEKELEAEVEMVNGVLDELAALQGSGFSIALVEPGKQADLRLAVKRENDLIPSSTAGINLHPALFFLPASGDISTANGSKPPLVAVSAGERAKLLEATKKNLVTIFRATGLSRLAAASDYKPEEVSVTFQLKRQDSEAVEDLLPGAVPRAYPGDEVHVIAKNDSDKLIDINVLYIGSDYSITHITSERLAAKATLEEGLLAFTDSSFGMERMIAVMTEAPALSEIEDLSFLAQEGVPSATRDVSGRGPGGGSFSEMLTDIGLAQGTRSAMKLGDKAGPKGGVMIFPIETVPRG
jgi:hypothetical protein